MNYSQYKQKHPLKDPAYFKYAADDVRRRAWQNGYTTGLMENWPMVFIGLCLGFAAGRFI